MNEQEIYRIIQSEVDKISHWELGQVIRLIINKTRDVNNSALAIDPKIQAEVDYWSGQSFLNSELTQESRTGKIRQTCDVFYSYFNSHPFNLAVENLRSDAVFANRQVALALIDPADTRHTMSDYCEYIKILSTKPKNVCRSFLYSFPPNDEAFMQCSGGTRTRIDKEIIRLTVSKLDKLLYEVHEISSSVVHEKLKSYVKCANHIHIDPYLNYALGFQGAEILKKLDNNYLTPQFEIPSSVMFASLHNYDKIFKERLLKDEGFISHIRKAFEENIKLIEEIFQTNQTDINSVVSSTPVIGAIESKTSDNEERLTTPQEVRDLILYHTKSSNIGDLVENENDDSDVLRLSEEKVLRLVIRNFFSNFFTKEKTLKEQRRNQGEIDPLFSQAGLFASKTPNHLAKLLASSEIEEVIIGIEALWVLAEKMISNSPFQVVKTINFFGGKEKMDQLRETLADHPNYQNKISRIKENFDAYVCNPLVNALLNPDQQQSAFISFKNLLEIGATTKAVKEFLEESEIENLKTQINSQKLTSKILSRPDHNEIFLILEDKGVIKMGGLTLEGFLETKPNPERFLRYMEKRDQTVFKREFYERTSFERELHKKLIPAISDPKVLKGINKKGISLIGCHSNFFESFLDSFVKEKPDEKTLETIVYFLESTIAPFCDKYNHFRSDEIDRAIDAFLKIPYKKQLIEKLRKKEPPINIFKGYDESDGKYYSFLLDLAKEGNVEANGDNVRLLSALGLDLDKALKFTTPAHEAVINDNLQFLKLFKECKATLEGKDALNKRPIHLAIKENKSDIFNYLLECEIRVEQDRSLESLFSDYAARAARTLGETILFTIHNLALPFTIVYDLTTLPGKLYNKSYDKIGDQTTFVVKRQIEDFTRLLRAFDPSLTIEAAQYGRADFLKTLLIKGAEVPFVTVVPTQEIRTILDAAQRAEDISKSVVSIIKKRCESDVIELPNQKLLDKIKTDFRSKLLQDFKFDVAEMEKNFQLRKSLCEKIIPHSFIERFGYEIEHNVSIKNKAEEILNLEPFSAMFPKSITKITNDNITKQKTD